jgi:hypothetical protein
MLRRIIGKGKIFSDHCNVGNFLLKCCSSLALGVFPKYSTLKIFPAASFSDDVGAHDLAAAPLSGATSEETEASKWPWAIMGLRKSFSNNIQ